MRTAIVEHDQWKGPKVKMITIVEVHAQSKATDPWLFGLNGDIADRDNLGAEI